MKGLRVVVSCALAAVSGLFLASGFAVLSGGNKQWT